MPTTTSESHPSSDERVLAAFSYLWVFSILLLFLKRDSEFIQFHARQGLVLFLVSTLSWALPGFGAIINAIVLILVFFGFFMAWSGTRWKMPFVGKLAEKIKL